MIPVLSVALVQKERPWYKRKENIVLYVGFLDRFRESPVHHKEAAKVGVSTGVIKLTPPRLRGPDQEYFENVKS